MNSDIFLDNIKRLKENKYNLRALEKLKASDIKSLYSVSLTKDGSYAILYNKKSLTSIYSPREEAKRLIANSLDISRTSSKLTGIFFSIASFYHIDYFLSLNKNNLAIVVEKDTSLVREILENVTYDNLKRTVIILSETLDDVISFLDFFIEENDIKNIVTVRHSRGSGVNKDYYDTLQIAYSNLLKEKLMSLTSNYYFAPLWSRNILYNMRINKAMSIESYKNFLNASYPILLISAGASIDGCLSKIKELSYTHFVLVLSHALNTLLENGIIPDAVMTTDGGFYSSIHLLKLIDFDIAVFTTHSAYPYILNHIENERIFYFSHNESFEKIIYKNSVYFPMEGSVIMPALRTANMLNPSHIVLAGCDFCYVDNKSHSKYSSSTVMDFLSQNKLNTFENIRDNRLYSKDNIECFDNICRPTSPALLSYYRHFSTLVGGMDDFNIYYLTPKSAKINNMKMYEESIYKNLKSKDFKLEKKYIEKVEDRTFLDSVREFLYFVDTDNMEKALNDRLSDMIAPYYKDKIYKFKSTIDKSQWPYFKRFIKDWKRDISLLDII